MTLEETIAAAVEQGTERAVKRILEELRRGSEPDDLVSEAEAARRLGLSLRTIQRRIKDGSIPSVLVGGSRRLQIGPLLRRAS